ncbi:MAG: cyclic lactone autoinducer peptide [Lacrimispora celerecrescens]|nr:cyclic lactone autoinducer peptide [Lacrimispora celerecrescens]
MNKLIIKVGGMLASLALMVTALNINTTCIMYAFQPELPQKARKLRRF